MVDDEHVEVAEDREGLSDEGFAVFGGGEILLDRETEGGSATFVGQGFGLILGGAIAESYAGSGLAEEADRCGADPT